LDRPVRRPPDNRFAPFLQRKASSVAENIERRQAADLVIEIMQLEHERLCIEVSQIAPRLERLEIQLDNIDACLRRLEV
jgi:hypothetical protein